MKVDLNQIQQNICGVGNGVIASSFTGNHVVHEFFNQKKSMGSVSNQTTLKLQPSIANSTQLRAVM